MPTPHSLTVISLGGGVQSSVMALMASQGAFDAMPDCAIFADTHWEPPTIYTHLDWLASHVRFPLYIVDNGRSLREDAKAIINHSGNRNFVDLPVYLKGRCQGRRDIRPCGGVKVYHRDVGAQHECHHAAGVRRIR